MKSHEWRCIEDVFGFCVIGKDVKVFINYILYAIVKRVIGQRKRDAVVAACVVRWKKGIVLRKFFNLVKCCLGDVLMIAILFKK